MAATGCTVLVMTALVHLQSLLDDLADRLGFDAESCRPPMIPRSDSFHLVPKGDRFDLIHPGDASRCESGLGLEDAAYEVLFAAALVFAHADAAARGDGSYSRWNWMGAHIHFMEQARPDWGDRTRAHYRRILTAEPLSDAEIAAIRPGLLRPDKPKS